MKTFHSAMLITLTLASGFILIAAADRAQAMNKEKVSLPKTSKKYETLPQMKKSAPKHVVGPVIGGTIGSGPPPPPPGYVWPKPDQQSNRSWFELHTSR